jgi:hypothetical protein
MDKGNLLPNVAERQVHHATLDPQRDARDPQQKREQRQDSQDVSRDLSHASSVPARADFAAVFGSARPALPAQAE